MPVGRPTSERFREVQRILEEEFSEPEPRYVNGPEAAALDRSRFRVFRGRVYEVPPIPVPLGLDLFELQLQLLDGGNVAEVRRIHRELLALFKKLARPASGLGRLFWRLAPNPFRHASEREVRDWLDFFWLCRTGTPYRVWLAGAIENARQSTGSASSTSSAPATGSGHGHGPTSRTG